MITLKWPMSSFRRFVDWAVGGPVGTTAVLRVGQHRHGGELTWLVSEVTPWSIGHRNGDPTTQWIVGTRLDAPGHGAEIPSYAIGRLDFGQGPWSDHAWGVVRIGDQTLPLDVLDLVGPGLHRPRLTGERPARLDGFMQDSRDDGDWDRRSRTIAAMGGHDAWSRLVERTIGLVGCGRIGSLVATSLARLGARDILLIDPDRLEPHNLGEGDGAYPADIGRTKVEALADELRRIQGSPVARLTSMACPVERSEARSALADRDIIIGAVDHDAPRLVLGWTAAYHHLVLLDLGTGVHRDEPTSLGHPGPMEIVGSSSVLYARRMRAEVRLIVPGDGCLLCRSGLADHREAFEALTSGWQARSSHAGRSRTGSLRSVNQIAAAVGLTLLQDLATGRVAGSKWVQIEWDGAGRLRSSVDRDGVTSPTSDCPFCARAGRAMTPSRRSDERKSSSRKILGIPVTNPENGPRNYQEESITSRSRQISRVGARIHEWDS